MRQSLSLAALLALAARGGDGPPCATVDAVKLTGTAMGQAPLAGAILDVQCTGGSVSTTRAVAAMLTAPPVANCQAARNVVYRIMSSSGTSRLASPDFATKVLSETETLALSSTQPCEFSLAMGNAAARGQVAASGWLVTAVPAASGKDATLTIAFPEQSLTLADLKGTWNTVEIERDGTQAASNSFAVLEIDDKGGVKASNCAGVAACVADDTLTLTANANGGYTLASVNTAAPVAMQLYAYKAHDGRKAIAVVGAGMLALAAPQAALTLPAVGMQSQSLDMVLSWNGSLLNASVSDGGSRVTAVDDAGRRYTRQHDNGRIDEIIMDTPRAGLRLRQSGEFQGSPFAGLIQLPLVAGVTAYGGLGSPRFGVSVTR